jgi:hypothetical protein
MITSKMMLRAAVVGFAFCVAQGCAGKREKPEDKSFTDTVVESLYTKRVYITGSRLPKQVDTRRSLDSESAQPVKVVKTR